MLNLNKGTRPDEVFYLQWWAIAPNPDVWGWPWLCQRVHWPNLGEKGCSFSSWILFWVFRWYRGTAKCDGTRTRMYWQGQLDDGQLPMYTPSKFKYVITSTPKEMFSFRFSLKKPDHQRWDNMGGI